MSNHATLSPSKRNRWAACPASIREEKKYPDERSNPAAIDGTHTHTLLNKCLTEQKSPSEYIGQTLKDEDGEFKVDAARAERVEFALQYINGQQINLGFPEWHSEVRVDPVRIFKRDDLAGTVDVLLIGADTIEIIDYKDGLGVVEADDNPQLDQYGFGVIARIADENLKVTQKTMRFTIIQPKLRERGLSGVVSYEKPMTEFFMGETRLATQAAATDDPNAPFVAGDHCHWCKHKTNCTARNGGALEVMFADLSKPTMDDQIRKIIENKAVILDLIEGAEREALRRFEIGQPIEGLKAVRGRGSRDWSVDEDKLVDVLKKCGVPSESCYEKKLISPAKMEKLKWIKKDGSEHTLSDKHRAMLQTEYIKKSDGSLSVVSVSDKRPAVESSPQFDAIPSFLQSV
jgi:hypothetical protein